MNKYLYDNQHIAEGDIFYSSWGYEQTNVDFYMVKKKIGKGSAEIVPVENKMVDELCGQTQDAVVPYVPMQGKPFLARIKYVYWDNYKTPRISVGHQTAQLWDGTPKHQTNAYYGH